MLEGRGDTDLRTDRGDGGCIALAREHSPYFGSGWTDRSLDCRGGSRVRKIERFLDDYSQG